MPGGVYVGVMQPGQNPFALQIGDDGVGAHPCGGILIAADEDDVVAADRHRRYRALLRVGG